MDRMIHSALNSLHNLRDLQRTQAQNLANQNVPGFRRDLDNNGSTAFLKQLNQAQTRAFQLEAGGSTFSQDPGNIQTTGAPTDVAIDGDGYLYIRPQNGDPALSRRGDLRQDAEGFLRDGAGNQILDDGFEPINLPPYRQLIITELGELQIEPIGGEEGIFVPSGFIATVVPAQDAVFKKFEDGNIRLEDGTVPEPNQSARMLQGSLEGSNVNVMEELISSIELQRSFEIGMKVILAAKDLDEGGSRLMRAPD